MLVQVFQLGCTGIVGFGVISEGWELVGIYCKAMQICYLICVNSCDQSSFYVGAGSTLFAHAYQSK